MNLKGRIVPIRDKIIVSHMNFDHTMTKSGIFITSDNGKTSGIHPRWGKVWAIGREQKYVKVGEWVLIEHGRWTRTVVVEQDNGEKLEIRMVDNDAIMAVSESLPEGTE